MFYEGEHPRNARFRKDRGGEKKEFTEVPQEEIPEEFTEEKEG